MRRVWIALLAGGLATAASWPSFVLASDDRYSGRQWNLARIRTEAAWATGQGAGTTIAIVDTGVDTDHPDLAGAFVPGFDFVDNDADADDQHGHGTHVAGIAAARANNARGVAGVAPEAKIMPIRVLNERGRGDGDDVEAGVRWAVDHGADVVNLSLSGSVVVEGLSRGTLNEIVDYAWTKGVVAVIAAGNGGLFRTDSGDARRLLVTATTTRDTRADYATSVGFADWGIAAPGGDDAGDEETMIYSTYWDPVKGSGYGYGMGTSMAAPHVAGTAAILRGLGLDAPKTVERILTTARDIGEGGEDFDFGNGLVDVAAAVKGLAKPATATAPPVPTRKPEPKADPAPAIVRTSAPAPAAPGRAEVTVDRASPRPTDRARVVASDELSEKSAIANIVLAATLLSAAAGLVGYGSFRRLRSRA